MNVSIYHKFLYFYESSHEFQIPENVYFADFVNTFAFEIYPKHGFKNPEFRENPENFHLCYSFEFFLNDLIKSSDFKR